MRLFFCCRFRRLKKKEKGLRFWCDLPQEKILENGCRGLLVEKKMFHSGDLFVCVLCYAGFCFVVVCTFFMHTRVTRPHTHTLHIKMGIKAWKTSRKILFALHFCFILLGCSTQPKTWHDGCGLEFSVLPRLPWESLALTNFQEEWWGLIQKNTKIVNVPSQQKLFFLLIRLRFFFCLLLFLGSEYHVLSWLMEVFCFILFFWRWPITK